MEDTTNLSPKADASLYNGQPSDTGLSCPSAGLTSRTPSISEDSRNGVSVENVPAGNKQWFVLRVSYGRIDKAKTFVEVKGLECYVPIQYKEIRKQGKKRIVTEPLLPSLIFLHATAEQVEALLHDNKAISNESRALLSYYFDHTIHLQNNPDRNPPLTILYEAMNNFIRLTSIKNHHIIPVTSDNIQFKLGNRFCQFFGVLALVEFPHEEHVRASLNDGEYCLTVSFSHDGVHLEVTEARTVCLRWPFADTDAVGYGGTPASYRSAAMLELVPAVLIEEPSALFPFSFYYNIAYLNRIPLFRS